MSDISGGGGQGKVFQFRDGYQLPAGLRPTPDGAGDGRHYVYRDGEFLCAVEDLPLIQDRLDRRSWRVPQEGERTKRDAALDALKMTRCLLLEGESVPDAVAELRAPVLRRFPSGQTREVVPRVFPDIALPIQYHASWHPAGSRRDAPRLGELPTRKFLPLPGSGVTVGVIDTGMPAAPMGWFRGRCQSRPEDEDPLGDGSGRLTETDGHGRFIAGIVLRYAPGARVKVRRLPDQFHDWVTDSELAPAILALANEGVDIINLSVSGSTHENTGLGATQTVIADLRYTHPKLVVVVAAGNAGVDAKQYPGALANTISVGAVNQDDNSRPEFSNYGEWVNASAPGVDVHSIFVEGQDQHEHYSGYARWSGTSFAAPTVAAAIATTLSPGGWRQFLWFLRPRTAFEAAFRLISNSRLPSAPGSGTIVRPRPYVS